MANDNIFSGLRVVDYASFIAGPGAATMLSDFGADVIKVEPPGFGDPHGNTYKTPPTRARARTIHGISTIVTSVDSRSISNRPGRREVLERLVKWADVLVVNFPPPVRKRLKLTYEEVAPWNHRLIYADLIGLWR